jgi:predicted Zn-dependent protease
VEADPGSGLFHYSLGLQLLERGQPGEAARVLEEGERLSSSPELSRALARAYEALGEGERAREALARAAERERELREESLRGRTVIH